MRTCSLSEAKSALGRLADDALQGHPTVISRGGKLLILRAYEPSDPGEFDALIDEGIQSEHLPLRLMRYGRGFVNGGRNWRKS